MPISIKISITGGEKGQEKVQIKISITGGKKGEEKVQIKIWITGATAATGGEKGQEKGPKGQMLIDQSGLRAL